MGDRRLTEIQKILALPDPLLSFKWVCTYLPFNLKPEYMEAIDLPWVNISQGESVFSGSSFAHFPGSDSISSFSATFYEDSFGSAHAWIDTWKRKVKNFETRSYGLPSEYKQTIIVSLLDVKNDKVITQRITGVWPTETNSLSLNYTDGSSRIVLQQTFSCDDAQTTYHKSASAAPVSLNSVNNYIARSSSN